MKHLLLPLAFILAACSNNGAAITADSIDIGYGNRIYTDPQLDDKTIDALVASYNDLTYDHETSEELNYENAMTLIFVANDQISGTLVIDDHGVFEVKGSSSRYELTDGHDVYTQALDVFQQLQND